MNLKENLNSIKTRIESAKKRGGFDHPVQLVAATKTHPFSTVLECQKRGISAIGENRIQEAVQKFRNHDGEIPGLTKRFIGHLQSNKVKKCLDIFDTVDSVDSVRLLKKISQQSLKIGKTTPILFEINISGENQKNGFLPHDVDQILECMDEPNIKANGLMTIGPNTNDKQMIRESFVELRTLQEKINDELKHKRLRDLSMGMSNDFEIAVEEGSTMVRLGTSLFGPRGLKF